MGRATFFAHVLLGNEGPNCHFLLERMSFISLFDTIEISYYTTILLVYDLSDMYIYKVATTIVVRSCGPERGS